MQHKSYSLNQLVYFHWLNLAPIKQYQVHNTESEKLWNWMLLKMHVGGSHFYGLNNTCCWGRNQTFITRQQDHHRKNACATSWIHKFSSWLLPIDWKKCIVTTLQRQWSVLLTWERAHELPANHKTDIGISCRSF